MSAPAARIAWIDIAKAIAILLVVVFHVSTWFVAYVFPESIGSRGVTWWTALSNALIPVRIPLFFLASGFLAQRAIQRPWAELVRTRFAGLLWPFLLWTVLILVPWSYRVNVDDPLANAPAAVGWLVFGGAHFWFLPALVILLSMARLMRRWPLAAVLLTAVVNIAVISNLGLLVSALGPYLGTNVGRWLMCAVWFMLGCFLPRLVERVAGVNALWAIAGVVAFIALRTLLPLGVLYTAVVVALTVVGVASLIIASRFVSRFATVRRAGGYIAARTLPIYVTHAFVLELFAVAVAILRGQGWTAPHSTILNLVFVPAMVVIVVAASLGLYALSRRWGFPWLYAAPQFLTRTKSPGAAPV